MSPGRERCKSPQILRLPPRGLCRGQWEGVTEAGGVSRGLWGNKSGRAFLTVDLSSLASASERCPICVSYLVCDGMGVRRGTRVGRKLQGP